MPPPHRAANAKPQPIPTKVNPQHKVDNTNTATSNQNVSVQEKVETYSNTSTPAAQAPLTHPKKTGKVGLNKFKTKSVSIKGTLNPEGKEDNKSKKGNSGNNDDDSIDLSGPKTDFTQAQLNQAWLAFATSFEGKERDSLVATLKAKQPELLENFQLLLKLDNKVQEMELAEIKTDLLTFVRQQLNNFSIQMEMMIEEIQESKQLYTDTEKVKAMMEKNPVLRDLMHRFDLDVGF